MLTIIADLGQAYIGNRTRHFFWVKCSYCGKEFTIRSDTFMKARSCGCIKADIASLNVSKNHKHKQSNTRLYRTWIGMKDRCFNPNNSHYHNYGGRGITVCDEWVNDFENFMDWAYTSGKYTDSLTIERLDVDGNYEPANCTFTTVYWQNRNRTTNIVVNGKCLTDLAKENGLKPCTVLQRYERGDRDIKDLLRPVNKRKKRDNTEITKRPKELLAL